MASGQTHLNDRTRILIVEDDEMQAGILNSGLTVAGFQTHIVTNGRAAMQEAQAEHYDAVLLDYNIPEMDGLATATLLRLLLGPLGQPVLIALTATPEHLYARGRKAKSAFDLVLDKSCGLSFVIFAITDCIKSAPDSAVMRHARALVSEHGCDDYFVSTRNPGGRGEDFKPARILVVEDHKFQRLLLRDILERRGYFVDMACNGMDAIRVIRSKYHDLVVIDYNLPEIDGMAVAWLVHEQMNQAVRPRLIALTATPNMLRGRLMTTGPLFDEIVINHTVFTN
jgi:CheY-like chemotaxis protein